MKVLIPLAEGFEELEAVAAIDVFRRAGWEVTTASLGTAMVKSSGGVRIVADAVWHEVNYDSFDILVLPGGANGTNTLKSEESVLQAVRTFNKKKKLIAAICAAPLVLQEAGILQNRKITGYPSILQQLTVPETLEQRVVVDDNIITSQGPATALDFALAVVKAASGAELANSLANSMLATCTG